MSRFTERLKRLEARRPSLPVLILRQGYHESDYTPGVYHDNAGKVYTAANVDELAARHTVVLVTYGDWPPSERQGETTWQE